MGRLIDADEYMKKVCTYKETGCGNCKFQICCPQDQPTAYDKEKVIAQIQEEKFGRSYDTKIVLGNAQEYVRKG